ncbi:uncharacterized protein [Haliotis asinina]|uniref:uncharacterized protein n=1 Tax=Haliotis asinina TaxID=109174 RepID=UPI003531AEF3
MHINTVTTAKKTLHGQMWTNKGGRTTAMKPTEDQGDRDERAGNTHWCQCGHCISMTTSHECFCCEEWDLLFPKLRVCDGCITRHGDFETICPTDSVLVMSFVQHMLYKGMGGRAPDTLTNCGERLGKGVRKVIPACVVGTIPNKFPSPEYTVFKEALTFNE